MPLASLSLSELCYLLAGLEHTTLLAKGSYQESTLPAVSRESEIHSLQLLAFYQSSYPVVMQYI